jgi:hypothetical protein
MEAERQSRSARRPETKADQTKWTRSLARRARFGGTAMRGGCVPVVLFYSEITVHPDRKLRSSATIAPLYGMCAACMIKRSHQWCDRQRTAA